MAAGPRQCPTFWFPESSRRFPPQSVGQSDSVETELYVSMPFPMQAKTTLENFYTDSEEPRRFAVILATSDGYVCTIRQEI